MSSVNHKCSHRTVHRSGSVHLQEKERIEKISLYLRWTSSLDFLLQCMNHCRRIMLYFELNAGDFNVDSIYEVGSTEELNLQKMCAVCVCLNNENNHTNLWIISLPWHSVFILEAETVISPAAVIWYQGKYVVFNAKKCSILEAISICLKRYLMRAKSRLSPSAAPQSKTIN